MLRNYRLQNYNFKLLFNVLVLMAMGLLFIHSANPSFVVKQALGITMGLGIIIVVSLIDFQVFTRNAEILYIFNVIMLIGVKLFGKDVNGAKRWFSLGPLGTFQPSELSKVIMIIVIAAFLVKHQDDLNEPKILGKLALVCAVPLLLILKQPSLSSTLDICFIILGMIFMAGLSSKLIVRVLIIGVPLLAIFLWYVQTPGQVLLEPHQVARIMSFLHPENYADSTALQTSNSIMAIGSGGLFGKGFGSNTISNVSASDVNLVSENQTDFIFAVAGEEYGFMGCCSIVILLLAISVECIRMSLRAKDLSGKIICCGMASIISLQSFLNICVATGIAPNTGTPLPFVSYGLTSLISLYIGMGMVLNVGLQSSAYNKEIRRKAIDQKEDYL